MPSLKNEEFGIWVHLYDNRAPELTISRENIQKLLENNNSSSFTLSLERG